ncbi:hypothetical protein FB446DRAFT_718531 [Lentinula raphanica]|nr:hypothetical protein FB446DRAFT_718531 [Lentinula raphanica]
MAITLSLEDAQKVITKWFPQPSHFRVIGLVDAQLEDSYSRTRNNTTYMLDLASSADNTSTHTSFITISSIADEPASVPRYNSLQVYSMLIAKIHQQTSIPIPEPILDTSLDSIDYPFLLTPPQPLRSSAIIPLSAARAQNILTKPQEALIDLTLGQLLGQLHSGIQNDWFGHPSLDQPREPSYSWQETFVALLEPLLEHVHNVGIDFGVSYEDIRTYLSRAIAFFLFDDVEVPSLIWFTGSEDDIFITRPDDTSSSVRIAAIVPTLAHALWGDPLLETFFLPPGPSEAIKEGYVGGGGSPLLVFGRQHTKRLWYTIFLALVILVEREGLQPTKSDKKPWALKTLERCSRALKDAPCY